MLQPPVTSPEKTQEAQPTQLSARLDKNLLAYALAASAAGVGVLAAAEPAEAHIVATPVNISIPENGGIIQFDINKDGIPDFGLSANFYQFAAAPPPLGAFSSWLKVVPAQAGNEVWEVSSNQNQCAAAVHPGNLIDGRRSFKPGALIMLEAAGSYTRGRSSHCPWRGTHPPYLGLKFMINGQVHFGWARVNAALRNVVLTGFAYETVPNKPIVAGATDGYGSDARAAVEVLAAPSSQPGNLGMLALGASGLDARRLVAPALVAWLKPEDEAERAD
jgi:hypothetical protein